MTYLAFYIILMASSVNLIQANPCSDVSNEEQWVCDPETDGNKFFYCYPGGIPAEFSCPAELVFDNALQVCTWRTDDYVCTASAGQTGSIIETTTLTLSPRKGRTRKTTTTSSPAITTSSPKITTSAPNTTTSAPNVTTSAPKTTKSARTTTTSAPNVTTSAPNVTSARTTTTSAPKTTTPPATTGECNANNCQLPNCRCLGTDVPGGLNVQDIPQIVMLTFDDAVNEQNNQYYEQLYPSNSANALKNPNGCRTTGTFFVSGLGTNYNMVANLINKGNEVSSHSKDHSQPQYWSYEQWVDQIENQRQVFVHQTGLNASQFPGMRAPFLSLGGEAQYRMLKTFNFRYDSSMFGGHYTNTGAYPPFPFTLDFGSPGSIEMCDQERCPLKSYPGLWEVPIIRQYTPSGQVCSMTDNCEANGIPPASSKEQVKNYFRLNFNRHYKKNRSPFMISVHATFFNNVPNAFTALKEFMAEINQYPDVWQISINQMLDWMQNPKPKSLLHEIASWNCT